MHIFNVIFVSVLGTLLHFTYGWSGRNPVIGAFSAVNESTWEHLKLLFFPMLITTIIGAFWGTKKSDNYFCAKLKGILVSILFTVTFFYTSTGVIGKNYVVLNILTFYVAVILGEYAVWKTLGKNKICDERKAKIILVSLFLGFILFTFYPLNIGIFLDPVTGTYGI